MDCQKNILMGTEQATGSNPCSW